jgi:prevent-host-death family protein
MKRISATTMSRNLSDILDAVETEGETFVVVRRGKEVAKLTPSHPANGRVVKELLSNRPDVGDFLGDIRSVRDLLVTEDRVWPD